MIKVVMIHHSRFAPVKSDEPQDCIILRKAGEDSRRIEMAFPFLEDTPNIQISIVDAMMLRNALDDLVAVKMLDKTGGI